MKIKESVLAIKSVILTIHCNSGRNVKIEDTKIRYALEDLNAITEKIKLVNINIAFTNGDHKRANCDSKEKAISWLNLNNTKE